MAYNTIYETLTADPNDVVGALAYISYKKKKVAFYKSKSAAGGPTQAEIDSFHEIEALQNSLDLHRSHAEAMVANFLAAALDDVSERTITETRQDILYTQIGAVNTGLQTQLTTAVSGLQTQLTTVISGVQRQLGTISNSLEAKRNWLGWIRDVGGNLVVNIVTILVIGVIVIGYKSLNNFQQHTENKVGLGASDTPGAEAAAPAGHVAPTTQAAPAAQVAPAAQAASGIQVK